MSLHSTTYQTVLPSEQLHAVLANSKCIKIRIPNTLSLCFSNIFCPVVVFKCCALNTASETVKHIIIPQIALAIGVLTSSVGVRVRRF